MTRYVSIFLVSLTACRLPERKEPTRPHIPRPPDLGLVVVGATRQDSLALAVQVDSWLAAGARWLGRNPNAPLGRYTLEIRVEREPRPPPSPALFVPPADTTERTLRIFLFDQGWGALAHEVGHAILWAQRDGPAPLWLDEAFAEFIRLRLYEPRREALLRRVASLRSWLYSEVLRYDEMLPDDAEKYARAYVVFTALAQREKERWPPLVLSLPCGSGDDQVAWLRQRISLPPSFQ